MPATRVEWTCRDPQESRWIETADVKRGLRPWRRATADRGGPLGQRAGRQIGDDSPEGGARDGRGRRFRGLGAGSGTDGRPKRLDDNLFLGRERLDERRRNGEGKEGKKGKLHD